MMGNRRLNKIECFYVLGMHESEQFKVTALNLFHPTASPRFQKANFLYYDTVSWGRGEGEGVLRFHLELRECGKGGLLFFRYDSI
jgi:hypothetical protein